MQPPRGDPDNCPPEGANAILKHAPHRLGPPDRPGRRLSIVVFSLRWDAFPAVVSLFPLQLARHKELNPGPNCHACGKPIRRGMDYLECQSNFCTSDSTPAFPGFSVIHQDRPASHHGGGLLTLVKEGIEYQRIAEVYQPPMEKQSIQI